MGNLHKAYYKDYFEGLKFNYLLGEGQEPISEIKRRNEKLTGNNLLQKIDNAASPNEDRFTLEITYPGLVTGVGINHEAKIEGEFKLGVHFDWTHGMPVVYGSSVKGVLRNAFIEEQIRGNIVKFENYFLNKVTKRDWDQDEIKVLFNAIFEGKDANGNNLSIYNRDIFFDAVIVNPDGKGRILCSDSITPHGGPNHDNPLKNPTPITFMKIAPGCKIEFRFKLVDTVINGNTFTKAQKIELFKEILTTVGVGAKTNVGYGQLK